MPAQMDRARLLAAYAECERLARVHYENFPVASWLVPAPIRPHIAALYAFARVADDFADEGRRTGEERLRLLDDWQNRLHACVADRGVCVRLRVTRTGKTCTTRFSWRWLRPFAPDPSRSICSTIF